MNHGLEPRQGIPLSEPRTGTPRAASPAKGRGRNTRTHLEDAIAAIWCDLLDLPWVDVDDDFFEVGGYSLLIPQMAADIAKLLQAKVQMRMLFEYSSIRKLVAEIERIGPDIG